jgi:serine/threonine protein kinase
MDVEFNVESTEEQPLQQQTTQPQQPTNQIGGKMLGQGGYGCAFQPPLKCVTVKKLPLTNHRVGKITSVQDAANEYSISKRLSTIPRAADYFVLVDEMCRPMPKNKQTDPDLPKCDAIKKVYLPSQAQLIMPFGGRPLAMTPSNPRALHFFALGQHLLEAGTLLLEGHLVHCDVHAMNVLLESPKQCRLIDFGLSWSPDELNVSNVSQMYRQFNPKIGQEPPEVSYLNGVCVENLPPADVLKQIFKDKLPLQLIAKLYGIPVHAQMEALVKFIKGSKTVREENQTQFYKLYWNKYDAWGIGVMLMSMFSLLSMYSEFSNSQEYKKNRVQANKVMIGLCMTDPGLRLDAAEALRMWAPQSPVLQRAAIKRWLHAHDKQRVELSKILGV